MSNTAIVPANLQNALVAGGEDIFSDELAAFLGQGRQTNLMLPKLKVNKHYIDDPETGTKLFPGTFFVNDTNGVEYYAKTCIFRPFMQTYQITEFDPDEKKFVGKTVQIKDWSEEMIDTKGGIRLGKMKSKEKKGLDKNDPRMKADKDKTMYRLIYGTVQMPHATARDGSPMPLTEPQPCVYSNAGDSFMNYQDEYLSKIEKLRKLQPQYLLNVTLERKQNGDVVYYVPHFDFDQSKVVPLSADDVELFKKFQETINFENEEVEKEYNKAVGVTKQTSIDADFVEKFAEGGLEDDFPESDI